MQLTPHAAPPSQLHQQLGQQHLLQQISSSQAHSWQRQQHVPHVTANRQSPAALSQNQALEPKPNQPLPSTAPHSAATAAATASVTQPQAGAEQPQSSITCSDRPEEHQHSTAMASDHPAPQQQSASVTTKPPSDDQQATDGHQSRGKGGKPRVSQGGLSQGVPSRRSQVGSLPPDGEALSEQQQVSIQPQLQSQPQSPPYAPNPQHMSQLHAQSPAQSHERSHAPSHAQAHGRSVSPTQLQQQQSQSHVPRSGVLGNEDGSTCPPDSPTPTLHYSPGPRETCDGTAEQAGSDPQLGEVCF